MILSVRYHFRVFFQKILCFYWFNLLTRGSSIYLIQRDKKKVYWGIYTFLDYIFLYLRIRITRMVEEISISKTLGKDVTAVVVGMIELVVEDEIGELEVVVIGVIVVVVTSALTVTVTISIA